MSWPHALLTLEKQYQTDITTSVSAQRPLMPSKRHANNTGTAAYATKPVPTYFSIMGGATGEGVGGHCPPLLGPGVQGGTMKLPPPILGPGGTGRYNENDLPGD